MMLLMTCEACASEDMADRGILGGLHWHQCRRCGWWSHYRPDPRGGINLDRIDRSGEGEPHEQEENDDDVPEEPLNPVLKQAAHAHAIDADVREALLHGKGLANRTTMSKRCDCEQWLAVYCDLGNYTFYSIVRPLSICEPCKFHTVGHGSWCESCVEDIHTTKAAKLYGVLPGEVDPEQRRIAKILNFHQLYGGRR